MLLSDLALAGCVYAYGRMRTAGTTPAEPGRPAATRITSRERGTADG